MSEYTIYGAAEEAAEHDALATLRASPQAREPLHAPCRITVGLRSIDVPATASLDALRATTERLGEIHGAAILWIGDSAVHAASRGNVSRGLLPSASAAARPSTTPAAPAPSARDDDAESVAAILRARRALAER
jgi:hypothetical protein